MLTFFFAVRRVEQPLCHWRLYLDRYRLHWRGLYWCQWLLQAQSARLWRLLSAGMEVCRSSIYQTSTSNTTALSPSSARPNNHVAPQLATPFLSTPQATTFPFAATWTWWGCGSPKAITAVCFGTTASWNWVCTPRLGAKTYVLCIICTRVEPFIQPTLTNRFFLRRFRLCSAQEVIASWGFADLRQSWTWPELNASSAPLLVCVLPLPLWRRPPHSPP